MELSIIIVSYNTKKILEECLQALGQHKPNVSHEIFVVDNNSSDGSKEMVAEKFPQVNLITNKENMGFSKANNIALKKAKGKYLLFLNSDAIVKQDTINHMVTFLQENKQAGAATCKVELIDGTLDDAAHRGFPTPWNAFAHFSGLSKIFPKTKLFGGYNMTWMDMTKTHEIDALAGAFMLVRREAGEQAGWWDETYFFYGEDIDFCYTLKKNGWKIYYCPEVSVLHYKGVSGGIKEVSKEITKANIDTKMKAQQERFKAMKIFYKKHYLHKYPKIVTWFVMQGIDLKLRVALESVK